MDNWYAAPQLLAIVLTNYNVRVVNTCKASQSGYKLEKLQLESNRERDSLRNVGKPETTNGYN